jgi:hypothetical protein
MAQPEAGRPRPERWLQGAGEVIFKVLPETVLANARHPRSENALLWNTLYPRLWPSCSLSDLLTLPPISGTPELPFRDEDMRPYFWGYGVDGQRLPGLDAALDVIDGQGPQTEVDLFLLGPTQLVLVEAKHTSRLGRCSRFGAGRCPEVHGQAGKDLGPCRYWDLAPSRFLNDLDLVRPVPDSGPAECNRHYQLARTLRLGMHLAGATGRDLHLWMVVPRRAWAHNLRKDWADFADRVKQVEVWRRLRVLAWEDVRRLPTH